MRTNQSTLTGESRPVAKIADAVLQEGITYTEVQNMVFAVLVATGTGKAVVGNWHAYRIWQIAHLTQEMKEELSPLQIDENAKIVTIIAVVGAVFFVISLLFARMALAESFILVWV
jgi:magnesium-transporting ATPase (P-type)